MKTLVLLIALLTSTMLWGETVTPTVPNGDFEIWNIKSYTFPENFLFNSNTLKAKSNMPYNVFQTSDCYHGKSAVKLVTDTSNTDNVNFGFIIGSNGENGDPSTWKGGIPITKPVTGIRGYYKYDFSQPDSALIIVTFRYHGTFLAEYDFFLKEKKSVYSLFNFDIVPKWDQAISPDTVIVGFASSGNVEKNHGQPGSTLFLDSISFKGWTTQPYALNGDFERWTQHITPFPQDWNLSGTEQEYDWRTQDKYEGNYAVKLITYLGKDENEKPAENPRVLYLGNLDKSTNQWSGGMHLSSTLDSLSFWYKYLPNKPNDNASLMLLYLNNNTLFTANSITIPASATYREMKVSLQMPNMTKGTACELVMMFNSSQLLDTTFTHIGSTLFLDHLTLLQFKGKIDTIQEGPNPVLENEGFELWDNHSYDIPTGYPYTSNLIRQDGSFPYNVTKVSLAQHGSYALRLETDNLTGNANFGFIINQIPRAESPYLWTGGIPISERPIGMQGYYMFHSVGLDSAMLMVHFMKNGLQLGLFFLHLQPAMYNWTYFNKPFSPALTETPDSMILTIASGSNLGGLCPPGSVLMIDNISLTGVTTQPAGMNGDFEDWVTVRKETAPGWSVSDQEKAGVHQSTNAAVGSYAMEIRTTTHTNESGLTSVEPMWVSNGQWNRNSQNWVGGTPLHTLKDTLAFYYQYIPSVPDDTAQLSMMFKYQGQFTASNIAYLLPKNAWNYHKVALSGYGGFGMPVLADSILVVFQSSLWDHNSARYSGSTLLLDDVHFLSSRMPIRVKSIFTKPSVEINPNPTHGLTRMRFYGELPKRVEVFNLSGQRILYITGKCIAEETTIDLTDYAAGLYLVRIVGDKQTNFIKLILK
jgi:hypothetical protein